MKIELVKEKLQKALTKTERLTSKHLSLPILSHVLLIAKRNSLTLRATNLDMGVEYTIPARVEREGVVAVQAGVFTSFISTLPGITGVSLEGGGGKLLIQTPMSKAVLPTSGHEDFPTIPKPTGESFTLGPEALTEGFRSVQYAGAPGNLKPELGSVYLHHEGKELLFVATDSFRLAEKKILLKKETPITGVLVPLKNAVEFVRLLEDEAGGEVALSLGKGQLSIETRSLYAASRLVEGTFPDYRQIIPKEAVTEATLLKEDLLNALKVATLFSDRFNQVRFHIDPKQKLFELTTRNGDIGESTTTLPSALEGAPLESNFNHRYISDCLGAIPSDSLSLRFSGEGRPLLVGGVGDATFRYLVMPMNR